MKHWICVACLSLASIVAVGTQAPAGRGANEPAVSPGELQRMFDAYALMQAQDQLKIDDQHYPQFLTRFKALQEVRRKALFDRMRTIGELRRLGNDPQSDENQIKDQLRALQDIDARSQTDTRKAYDAVDQILDVHQQAKFRAFEEAMERRKLELVSRARQANRQNKPQ
jgi:Spy/CpxP family protein refolding chaperone